MDHSSVKIRPSTKHQTDITFAKLPFTQHCYLQRSHTAYCCYCTSWTTTMGAVLITQPNVLVIQWPKAAILGFPPGQSSMRDSFSSSESTHVIPLPSCTRTRTVVHVTLQVLEQHEGQFQFFWVHSCDAIAFMYTTPLMWCHCLHVHNTHKDIMLHSKCQSSMRDSFSSSESRRVMPLCVHVTLQVSATVVHVTLQVSAFWKDLMASHVATHIGQ